MTSAEFKLLQYKSGMGNKELAELLKVHVNTISYWKSGYRRITDAMEKYIRLVLREYIDAE